MCISTFAIVANLLSMCLYLYLCRRTTKEQKRLMQRYSETQAIIHEYTRHLENVMKTEESNAYYMLRFLKLTKFIKSTTREYWSHFHYGREGAYSERILHEFIMFYTAWEYDNKDTYEALLDHMEEIVRKQYPSYDATTFSEKSLFRRETSEEQKA